MALPSLPCHPPCLVSGRPRLECSVAECSQWGPIGALLGPWRLARCARLPAADLRLGGGVAPPGLGPGGRCAGCASRGPPPHPAARRVACARGAEVPPSPGLSAMQAWGGAARLGLAWLCSTRLDSTARGAPVISGSSWKMTSLSACRPSLPLPRCAAVLYLSTCGCLCEARGIAGPVCDKRIANLAMIVIPSKHCNLTRYTYSFQTFCNENKSRRYRKRITKILLLQN